MNTIVAFLARHLRSVLFFATLLLAAGVLAALHLRQELEPEVRTHYAVITAVLPGSTAQELQEMVARPVEELIRQVPGITDYQSRAGDGICIFTVELDGRGGAAAEVRERLRNRLASLRQEMARNIVGLNGPQIDDSVATTYDLIAAIPAPGGDFAKLRAALPAITRAIAAVPAVDGLEVIGLPAEQVVVEYRDAELADVGFSPQLLCALLKSQSFLAPGGYLDDAKTLSCIHIDARLRTLDELREVSVLDPVAGRPTTLDRLLTVKTEKRIPANPAVTLAGQPGLCLAVARRTGTDPKAFSALVRQQLESACRQAGLAAPAFMLDNAEFIAQDYRGFMAGLGVSAAIMLILLVAVLGLRTGSLVAVMIPLVIFSTLAVLLLLGCTINLVVLAALTIASGIVTDNHIVVAQHLSRRLQRGLARLEAIGETFRILAGPLLAATLAAVAGFLPIILSDHVAGEFLADLVPVMGIALFFSYLYAFTVTPFLCRASAAATPLVVLVEQGYRQLLGRVLERPRTVIATAILLTLAGSLLLAQRPTTFFPNNHRAMLSVELIYPAGTSQETSSQAIQAVGQRVQSALQASGTTSRARWVTFCGRGLPRISRNTVPAAAGPNCATALIAFESAADLAAFQQHFAPAQPGALCRVRPVAGGPQITWPIQIRLKGAADSLTAALPVAQKELAGVPELANLHLNGGGLVTKWTLSPKRQAAANKGVTPADIALAMNVVTNGLPAFDLGAGDQAIPVIVRPKKTATDAIENLKDAYVYPTKGQPCIMADVADIKTVSAPATIERCRGLPAITFVADCAPGANPYAAEQAAVARLEKALAKHPGVSVESIGLAKTATDANASLVGKMPWALAAMFLVLLFQTRSFRLNLLILAAIPFGIAGAGLGLALAGFPVGFMPLIGLTSMAGIAVNVTIVMVASISDHLKEPEPADPAGRDLQIIEGAADRIEPILLSTACAIGGMIPLYIFGGELWHSMVVTLVASLLVSALLIILVVPATFKLLAARK